MVVTGNQPFFIPYLAFYQIMKAADVFLIGDNYFHIKKSWIKRNRILMHGRPMFFGIPIKDESSFRLISETEIQEIPLEKCRNTLYEAYHGAPYYDVGMELMEDILAYPTSSLIEFLIHSLDVMRDYLRIDTPMRLTSSFEGNDKLKFDGRLYDYCHRLGADTYINAMGGFDLYSFEKFREQGITLKFLKPLLPEYKQFDHEFVPMLSVIDVVMFNSREDCIRMLDDYTMIDENNAAAYRQ